MCPRYLTCGLKIGIYEYTKMPMGLCNSAATFQRLMQHIFNDTVFQILLIYLDDLIIYSVSRKLFYVGHQGA
jgi:hypothetical protein